MANQIARTHRTDKGEPGGSATRPHRRRYAITDEAMLQEAGAKLSAFPRNSYVKVASDVAEAAEQFSEAPADEEVELEAASGLEPESRGFAGRKDDSHQPSPNPVKLDDPRF